VNKEKSIPICLPSIDEQHAIVTEIESRFSVCEKMRRALSKVSGRRNLWGIAF